MKAKKKIMIRTPEIIYNGNANIKRDGVTISYTEEQFLEYARCKNSPAYFAKKYCKIIHPDTGLVPFNLYPYQEKMYDNFENNRFNIVLACRQSGKSIAAVGYVLHYAIFQATKNVAVLANKAATAREMLARITLMLENLPFWLQPGCKALNKSEMTFSNNSKIFSAGTSSSSIRGITASLIYLDEFAFVDSAELFYTSTYPVISAGKQSKVIITSTANGVGNMFYKIWEGASQKTNKFVPFRVDWWDVPGRDEAWKKLTISNTSELQFAQEFGNSFLGTGNTLIDAGTLLSLKAKSAMHEFGPVKIYEESEDGHSYAMTVDVSQGIGSDYSTFSIIDTTSKPFKQVATYRDDKISPILFPDHIVKWAKLYNDAYVIVENNDQGLLVCNGIYQDLEYENLHMESMVRNNGLGIRMTTKVKRVGCSGFKDILESGNLEIYDADTISEISTFEQIRNSYEASQGNHDDLVMNLVLFGYFAASKFFNQISDVSLREFLHNEKIKMIESTMVPFGHVSNGIDDNPIDELNADNPDWAIDKKMFDIPRDPEEEKRSIWQKVDAFDYDIWSP